MAKKIKCIVKRSDEQFGHVTWISDSLENLQKTVGGYIETICFENGMTIICNENGRSSLPFNFPMNAPLYSGYCGMHNVPVCGTVIICGISNNEFNDIPINFDEWKKLLESWIKDNARQQRKEKYFIGYCDERNKNASDTSKYKHEIICAFDEKNARLIFETYYPKEYRILTIVGTGEIERRYT